MQVVDVYIQNTPKFLNQKYAYRVKETIDFGSIVLVDFNKRKAYGFVVSNTYELNSSEYCLKYVNEVIANRLFSKEQYDFACWLSSFTFTSIASILSGMFTPFFKYSFSYDILKLSSFRLNLNYVPLTKKQRELATLFANESINQKQINHLISRSTLHKYISEGFIEEYKQLPVVSKPCYLLNFNNDLTLKTDTFLSLFKKDTNLAMISLDQFILSIIQEIKIAIDQNESLAILVPNRYIGNRIYYELDGIIQNCLLYHEQLSSKDKLFINYALNHLENPIIISTSKLFLMKPNFNKLIIIQSEAKSYGFNQYNQINIEHELKYIQFKYHTRILYQSVAPLVKQFNQSNVVLNNEKPTQVSLVDMKQHYRTSKGVLSQQGYACIQNAINANQNCLIWLNRKGFYTYLQCQQCHSVLTCPKCGKPLSYQKSKPHYYCYSCNQGIDVNTCEQCGNRYFNYMGYGIERIQSLLNRVFENIPVYILDNVYILDHLPTPHLLIATSALFSYRLENMYSYKVGLDIDSNYTSVFNSNNEQGISEIFNFIHSSKQVVLQVNDITHGYIPYIQNNDYLGYLKYQDSYLKQMHLPPYAFCYVVDISSYSRQVNRIIQIIQNAFVNEPIEVYGPSKVNASTLRMSLYSENSLILTKLMNQLWNQYRLIWKNDVEIRVD